MLLETLSLALGKEMFRGVINDATSAMSKVTSLKVRQWNTKSKITSLYKKINNVRRVKTIWQIDKAVDLSSFYCDSHVVMDDARIKVERLDDFCTNDNLLIEGIAGQGKSIFLRYLCAVSLVMEICIPLFIELRKISESEGLMHRIYAELANLGLSVDETLFNALAESGKITLFLDAFDEIPEKLKKKSLEEIEDLASRYDALRIIITSRPHNPIEMSAHFRNVKLDDLKHNEYMEVIHKLSQGDAWADHLIEHIEKRAQHIRPLLCTPLMVTLLVLTYKSHKQLPNSLSGFYDSLFFTMLQRHDGTKPGFMRQRGCDLDDEQYRQVFEALCLISKAYKEIVFTYEDFYKFTGQALKEVGFNASPDKYLRDIITITCLIVRDGDEHRFIHKTVQEYYSAAFIAKKPDPWVVKFYQRMTDTEAFHLWVVELKFLSEIDRYRYDKYFKLPLIMDFLEITKDDLTIGKTRLSRPRLEEKLIPFWIGLSPKVKKERLRYFSYGKKPGRFMDLEQDVSRLFQLNFTPVLEAISSGKLKLKSEKQNRKTEEYDIDMVDILRAGIMEEEIYGFLETIRTKLFEEAKIINQRLTSDEKDDILEGLL